MTYMGTHISGGNGRAVVVATARATELGQIQTMVGEADSTVVNAVHTADSRAVDITYVHAGKPFTVRAKHCVMACYNSAIPYLCPELPEPQRAGLAYNVKVPITYTKVMIPHWRWFAELSTRYVFYTNDFFKQVELDSENLPIELTPERVVILAEVAAAIRSSGFTVAESAIRWNSPERRTWYRFTSPQARRRPISSVPTS